MRVDRFCINRLRTTLFHANIILTRIIIHSSVPALDSTKFNIEQAQEKIQSAMNVLSNIDFKRRISSKDSSEIVNCLYSFTNYFMLVFSVLKSGLPEKLVNETSSLNSVLREALLSLHDWKDCDLVKL